MAITFPATLDILPQNSDTATPDHVGLRLGVSARSVARGVFVTLVFFAGFAGGAIVGAEGERTVIEAQQTLW
ncbi:MAG: hypothetical protein VCE43_12550 [Myxococcota bacterium]